MSFVEIGIVFFIGFVAGCGWGYSAGLQRFIDRKGGGGVSN